MGEFFSNDTAPIEASVGLGKIARIDVHKVECEKSRSSSSSGALGQKVIRLLLKSDKIVSEAVFS